ncbi:hypothetical protein Hanom_Chr12g01073631 [Helianthus anomalus]
MDVICVFGDVDRVIFFQDFHQVFFVFTSHHLFMKTRLTILLNGDEVNSVEKNQHI